MNDAVVPADATFNERSRSEHPESELPPFHRISPSLTVFLSSDLTELSDRGVPVWTSLHSSMDRPNSSFFSISVHAL